MQNDLPDKLIVRGLPPLDGEYACDIVGMLTEGHPQSLTNREGHRIKLMSGVRAGELFDAMEAGDNDVLIALGAIVLTRYGRRFDENILWDAPMGSGLEFAIGEREEDAESPPAPSGETTPPSGGESTSSPHSANQENGRSPTGTPVSSLSVQETSPI